MSAPRYTHGHHESVLRGHRWRTAENSAAYLLPWLRPDQRLLDVGCGPGTITVDLAGRVGHVDAVEPTTAALELARDHARSCRQHNLTFTTADVHALPFADDTFDVVHAHQVLQHVADPVTALTEMRRVCVPGGLVAVRDSDYATFTWYPADPELDDWLRLYSAAARANHGEPDAGRHLLAWAHAAGFVDVTASTDSWCFATVDDREYWGGMWADRSCTRRWPTSCWPTAPPITPSCKRSPPPGAAGPTIPTAGWRCCTPSCSAAPERYSSRLAGVERATCLPSALTASPSTSSMRVIASAGMATPAALTFSATCSGRDAPTRAAATLSFCSTQAIASCAIDSPSSSAMGCRPATLVRVSSERKYLIIAAPPFSSVARDPAGGG